MKKRILSGLAFMLFLSACIFALAACVESEPPHTHNYRTIKFDEENHWFECECEDKTYITKHSIKNDECLCGYVVAHSHEYNELKKNLGLQDGNDFYIFGTTMKGEKKVAILTKKN